PASALAPVPPPAVIPAGPGALAFGSVVILTMLAAMQFDPRLIWDNVEHSGNAHE
ncbi:paraquat-inducible protein A, partial [Burkholderia pseudomallei OB]|uniref:paraquat-inducible protein A n=1 Tax=Burkholderia pseudomallei TaxID=28450 RepID=UPI001E5CDFD4